MALLPLCTIDTFSQNPLEMTEEEKAAYTANAPEAVIRAGFNDEDALAELRMKYIVPQKDVARLRNLVRRRECRKIAYDYIYPSSPEQRVKEKLAIDSVFQDSIDAILIPNNAISGENISYAVKAAPALKLDAAQSEYILNHAIDIARRLRKSPRLNVWNEEFDVLRKTLTEKQLETMMMLKNGSKVTRRVRASWSRLNEAGLTADLDSARECAKTYMYYLKEQNIKDIYKYYGTSQKKHLAELAKQQPKIVVLCNALDKKKRVADRPKNVGKDMVW